MARAGPPGIILYDYQSDGERNEFVAKKKSGQGGGEAAAVEGRSSPRRKTRKVLIIGGTIRWNVTLS